MGRRAERVLGFVVVVASLCVAVVNAGAQRGKHPTRVLVLYQQQAETKPMLEFSRSLRLAIQKELAVPAEFFLEALDFDRFGGREHSSPLTAYFDDKYRDFGVDVVVPVGGRALRFAVDHLHEVLPNVPIVFALCAAPQTDPASLPGYVTGRLASASRFDPTLRMARRLQPDADQFVVVGGAGQADAQSVAAAVTAAQALGDSLPVSTLAGMSLDALLPRLRQLSRRSIVIFANYRQDGQGRTFEPLDIVGSIARASAAPMYTQLRSYVGEGVVGGSVTKFDEEGINTGKLVARVLRRRAGDAMPPVQSIPSTFVADWRQLQRWDLAEKRLPAGTEVLFREPRLWQRYRTIALLALGVIAAELLLIGSLLFERRRRIRAQALAQEQQHKAEVTRRQVAHMGRVALVGELAATISHEVRQPLAAIRANAETGSSIMTSNRGLLGADHKQACGEIFDEIVADAARASDIIARVRALVRQEELPRQTMDLNEVCRTSARLLHHDAHIRCAEIALALDEDLPTIWGDPVQLQQVVLNLVLNALDACAASTRPQVIIRTVAREDDVELAVHDNGPGLGTDVQQHLFESFFTTKAQGLGLGLVIVQSIVERHHGRVRAENGEQGAVFRVVLPRVRGVRGGRSRATSPRAKGDSATPV